MSNMLLGPIKILVKSCVLKDDSLCYLIFNKYINHLFIIEEQVVEPIVINLRNKVNDTILIKKIIEISTDGWNTCLPPKTSERNLEESSCNDFWIYFFAFMFLTFKLLPLIALGGHR